MRTIWSFDIRKEEIVNGKSNGENQVGLTESQMLAIVQIVENSNVVIGMPYKVKKLVKDN